MLTLIFGIRASEPPLGPGERLKRPGLIGLSTCIQLRITKHPSQKVMNFRHLLSCDTIVYDDHLDHYSDGLHPIEGDAGD